MFRSFKRSRLSSPSMLRSVGHRTGLRLKSKIFRFRRGHDSKSVFLSPSPPPTLYPFSVAAFPGLLGAAGAAVMDAMFPSDRSSSSSDGHFDRTSRHKT